MCIDISGQLTIYFDCPFWVGVFEVFENSSIRTCKVVFGCEPKDGEVYNLILNDYYKLQFSSPLQVDANFKRPKSNNPKRLQRQIKDSIKQQGIGAKSQQALQKQREQNKIKHNIYNKQQKNFEKQMKYEMKKAKKKEKHKGH